MWSPNLILWSLTFLLGSAPLSTPIELSVGVVQVRGDLTLSGGGALRFNGSYGPAAGVSGRFECYVSAVEAELVGPRLVTRRVLGRASPPEDGSRTFALRASGVRPNHYIMAACGRMGRDDVPVSAEVKMFKIRDIMH